MPVFDKYKLIFHHIPKTGGTAVKKYLYGTGATDGPFHDGFMTFQQLNMRIRDERKPRNPLFDQMGLTSSMTLYEKQDRKKYRQFTIVRDPVDRVRSAWNHLLRGGIDGSHTEMRESYPNLFKSTFEKCVMHKGFNEEFINKDRHLTPISWMLEHAEISSIPTYVLDFENLERDLGILLKDYSLPSFVSSEAHYERELLSDAAMEKFRSLYESEYELLSKLQENLISRD